MSRARLRTLHDSASHVPPGNAVSSQSSGINNVAASGEREYPAIHEKEDVNEPVNRAVPPSQPDGSSGHRAGKGRTDHDLR